MHAEVFRFSVALFGMSKKLHWQMVHFRLREKLQVKKLNFLSLFLICNCFIGKKKITFVVSFLMSHCHCGSLVGWIRCSKVSNGFAFQRHKDTWRYLSYKDTLWGKINILCSHNITSYQMFVALFFLCIFHINLEDKHIVDTYLDIFKIVFQTSSLCHTQSCEKESFHKIYTDHVKN